MGNIRELTIEGHKVPIREFLLRWILKGASILVIAKKGSGKSWVCRCLIEFYSNIDIPGGMIISPTEKMDPFFTHFFPDMYVHFEYSSYVIDRLLERQEIMCEKFASKAKKGKLCDPRVFLLMDDCLAKAKSWKNDDGIRTILMNGRHYEMTYILTLQDPVGIPNDLRTNFDYIFLLADDFISNQKRIYEYYAGMFENIRLFRNVYSELTRDFGAMVIVNRGKRETILDKVFYYKSHKVNLDKIGCVQFRELAYRNFDEKWKEHNQSDPADVLKKIGRKKK
jgi:hypothetical protein